jgi:hypothetical protein
MRIPIAFALALGVVVLLGQSAAQPPEKKVLSLEAARKMAAAIGEAARNHWRGVVGLCCINRPEAALSPCIPLSADRRGLRPTQFPHPIEQSARDRRFPLLHLVPLCP